MKDEIIIDGVTYVRKAEVDKNKDWRDAVIETYADGECLVKGIDLYDNKCLYFIKDRGMSGGESVFWKKVFGAECDLWKEKYEWVRLGYHGSKTYEEMLVVLK